MTDTLVLVHTVSPLVSVFARLGGEMLPGVQLLHILDEPILERIRLRGAGLAAEDGERLYEHVAMAQQVGARAVLVTCSTISPCVDDVRPRAAIPVLKIDEAMIERAVALGARIGVVATAPTTLEPTRKLLLAQAARVGKPIETELVLVENAMAALMAGDGAAHDRLVNTAALDLARRVDVVILAQASMARALDALPEAERPVPILASPQLALERVKGIMRQT